MSTPIIPAPIAFVQQQYPGQYETGDLITTVGEAPVLVAENDPERMSLGLSNVGATDIYLRPVKPAGNGNGILLLAGGGSLTLDVRDDITLPCVAWYAYSTAAGGSVYATWIRRFAA